MHFEGEKLNLPHSCAAPSRQLHGCHDQRLRPIRGVKCALECLRLRTPRCWHWRFSPSARLQHFRFAMQLVRDGRYGTIATSIGTGALTLMLTTSPSRSKVCIRHKLSGTELNLYFFLCLLNPLETAAGNSSGCKSSDSIGRSHHWAQQSRRGEAFWVLRPRDRSENPRRQGPNDPLSTLGLTLLQSRFGL